MNMMNGMRKIGQKSGTKRVKENLDEEELNFDKGIEETLDEEHIKLNTGIYLPLDAEILKSKDKLDVVVENFLEVEESQDINRIEIVNNISDLPKLILKGENIHKQMTQVPLIKIDQEIDLNPENLEDIELPSDTVSKNSLEDDNHRSENSDKFSVYIKNVDYDACPEDLEEHFKHCGLINRITILIDKYTGLPKGYAFIEFDTSEAKEKAKTLNDSLFKGRQIKVEDKRRNIPEYFGKKVKSFNKPPVYYHNNNFMRGQPHSFYGPIKGRYMPSRNFKPY